MRVSVREVAGRQSESEGDWVREAAGRESESGCVRRVREDTDTRGRMREDEGGADEVISELTAATQAAEWAAPMDRRPASRRSR